MTPRRRDWYQLFLQVIVLTVLALGIAECMGPDTDCTKTKTPAGASI